MRAAAELQLSAEGLRTWCRRTEGAIGAIFSENVGFCDFEKSQSRKLSHEDIRAGGRNEDLSALRSPGLGRQITRVSTSVDADGNLKSQHIREQVAAAENSFEEPAGRVVKTTAQIGPGGIERVWERRVPDPVADTVERLDEILAKIEPMPPIDARASGAMCGELHTLHVLADAHIGLLAWEPETGADWDLDMAVGTLKRAVDNLMLRSPASSSATVALLGDFMHFDGLAAVTPTSGHLLDTDTRFSKLVDAAIDAALYIARRALEMHDKVDLLIAEGNHDLTSSLWMRKLFARLFADEPRLRVIDSPKPYYATTFGDVMLCFHHGHLKSVKSASDMIAYFAQEFREEWGRSAKHYVHTGHRHFLQVDGSKGAQIRQHPTLAARDAYASRYGYQAQRALQSITYHEKFGEVVNVTVTPEMLA